MLDLIIIVLAFIAGWLSGHLIFRQKLYAIERAVIASGLGIGISVLAFFFTGGFSGVKELRYDLWLMVAMVVIVSGVQIYLFKVREGSF